MGRMQTLTSSPAVVVLLNDIRDVNVPSWVTAGKPWAGDSFGQGWLPVPLTPIRWPSQWTAQHGRAQGGDSGKHGLSLPLGECWKSPQGQKGLLEDRGLGSSEGRGQKAPGPGSGRSGRR